MMNRAGSTAEDLSARPVPPEPGWQERIVRGADDILIPETVWVDGNQHDVSRPDSVLVGDGETAELTASTAADATIVIDLGRVAMGHAEIGTVGKSTAPLRVSFAQFRQFLGPDGDGMPAPFGTDAHPWSRVDVIPPADASTVWRSPGKREARYLAITLDGPGRAEIDFVRLRQTIYPVTYDGYFLSSDELLNRAWYHSAYGGELATITEDGTPWMLTVPYDRVLFMADLHLQALAGYYHSSDFFWLVRNTLLNDRDPMRDHTGDANAGNLMFETLDDERALAVMQFVDANLASPYGTRSSEYTDNPYRASDIEGYINSMEALGRIRYGDGAGAVNLIRRWWGHMLAHGPGTGWFAWNTDGTVDRGAWAYTPWTTALPALSEGVLGVRPTAPGYRHWRIAPQPAGLVWAQGRVPTPGGGITVRWVHADDTFRVTVEAPDHSEGEVAVPRLGEPRAVAMDGQLVWRPDGKATEIDAVVRGDAVVFSGIRGSHTFAWSGTNEA